MICCADVSPADEVTERKGHFRVCLISASRESLSNKPFTELAGEFRIRLVCYGERRILRGRHRGIPMRNVRRVHRCDLLRLRLKGTYLTSESGCQEICNTKRLRPWIDHHKGWVTAF